MPKSVTRQHPTVISLSLLEVEFLDRKTKAKCKEHRKCNHNNGNHWQKVMLKSKVIIYKLLHRSTILHRILYVSKL